MISVLSFGFDMLMVWFPLNALHSIVTPPASPSHLEAAALVLGAVAREAQTVLMAEQIGLRLLGELSPRLALGAETRTHTA